MSVGIDARS